VNEYLHSSFGGTFRINEPKAHESIWISVLLLFIKNKLC